MDIGASSYRRFLDGDEGAFASMMFSECQIHYSADW